MLPDQMGMNSDKVKIVVKKMESYIKRDTKIEYLLQDVEEQLKKAYKSDNSLRLEKNNGFVIEAQHIKMRNLKSYTQYIEKCILKYSKASGKAVDLSKNLLEKGIN